MDIRLKGGKVLDIPAGIHSKNKAKSLAFSMEGIGNKTLPYLMITPAMIICMVFMVYPIAYMVYLRRAIPSFPSQLEWKIGLPWANTRGILNSPS